MNNPRPKARRNGIARAEPALRWHGYAPRSRANGPGFRAVLWTQGCSLGCEGCFNRATHSFRGGVLEPARTIADRILSEEGIEGLTISGGEPFQQPQAVLELCRRLRGAGKLSIICFSGFTLGELELIEGWDPSLVDVLIAGRYQVANHLGRGLAGSSNKVFHFFSGRYAMEDFAEVPECEVSIDPSGLVLVTGIAPLALHDL